MEPATVGWAAFLAPFIVQKANSPQADPGRLSRTPGKNTAELSGQHLQRHGDRFRVPPRGSHGPWQSRPREGGASIALPTGSCGVAAAPPTGRSDTGRTPALQEPVP